METMCGDDLKTMTMYEDDDNVWRRCGDNDDVKTIWRQYECGDDVGVMLRRCEDDVGVIWRR